MQTLRPASHRLPSCPLSHASQHRHTLPAAARFRNKHFSISSLHHGHYHTLDIPKDASRNQIKSSFYKLSKQYHPDVNSDPGAKAKFQAVSEAYAVLGDERKRRAYDRTLTSPPGGHAHAPHEAHPAYAHGSSEGRRRGATHAWEYARRPNMGPRHSYYSPPPPPGSGGGASQAHPYANYGHHTRGARTDPFSRPHVQRATGRDTGQAPLPHESISVLGRAVTVAVLVFVIAAVGHGLSASAA